MTNQTFYNLLILLTLVSFGFFGSLSHIFSSALIITTFFNQEKFGQNSEIGFKAKTLFWSLSGCFILFFIAGLFHSNFGILLQSMSSMLPLPLISLLIVFHYRTSFKLNSKQLSQFSQISVLFSLILYLLLLLSTDPTSIFYELHTPRLTLFSGNPIPFSFVMLGLSIFSLADWRSSTIGGKVFALLFFLIGAYFSAVLSGTRGSLLSLFVILPIIIFYISSRRTLTFIFTVILTLICLFVITTDLLISWEDGYIIHIKNGIETLTQLKKSDSSILLRLEMWTAATKAISDAPLYGYGITERFEALKPYFSGSFPSFTHPHNDILAGAISAGFMGGLVTLISLTSGIVASLLSPSRTTEKFLFGLMISCTVLTTGNVSTVLFNDVNAAWLAFSAYLIWATDFKIISIGMSKSKL